MTMKLKSIVLAIASIAFLWAGCSGNSQSNQSSSKSAKSKIEYDNPVEYLGTGEPKFNIYPGTDTEDFADASIASWKFENGRFNFEIGGSSYQLQAQTPSASSLMCANSDEGQHLHVIVDKKPYSAQYSPSFDFNIPDGQHHLLVFLSKSYHESLKHPEAHIARLIDVKDGNITNEWDIPDPALFYSRPTGNYVGEDTKKILLDFYPVNIKLGVDAKIQLQVNGEQYYLYEWTPYFIEGLPYGDNDVGIRLVDMNGEAIPGTINSHFRKFKLIRGPEELMN